MNKLSSTLTNMLLSLTGICLVAATLLAVINHTTSKVIADSQVKALEKAIGEVTPKFDNHPLEEVKRIAVDGDTLLVYPAKEGATLQGVAVNTVSHNGFNGDVRILVGLDISGRILNYSVLEMNETPGLGDKMSAWFRDDQEARSIIGRETKDAPFSVKKDGGEVDAITAATISSRAFLDAINKGIKAYEQYLTNESAELSGEAK